MLTVGEIWSDSHFPVHGGVKKKFFLIAAFDKHSIVYRTTTSRQHGRRTEPPCFHGLPYPGHFFGDPSPAPFTVPTWLDLQFEDDLDVIEFKKRLAAKRLTLEGCLTKPLLCEALRCLRDSHDTSPYQVKLIDLALVSVGCV